MNSLEATVPPRAQTNSRASKGGGHRLRDGTSSQFMQSLSNLPLCDILRRHDLARRNSALVPWIRPPPHRVTGAADALPLRGIAGSLPSSCILRVPRSALPLGQKAKQYGRVDFRGGVVGTCRTTFRFPSGTRWKLDVVQYTPPMLYPPTARRMRIPRQPCGYRSRQSGTVAVPPVTRSFLF
jgi:hypothetical protein